MLGASIAPHCVFSECHESSHLTVTPADLATGVLDGFLRCPDTRTYRKCRKSENVGIEELQSGDTFGELHVLNCYLEVRHYGFPQNVTIAFV